MTTCADLNIVLEHTAVIYSSTSAAEKLFPQEQGILVQCTNNNVALYLHLKTCS